MKSKHLSFDLTCLLSLVLTFAFSSCASLNSVSITQVPANRNKPIETEASTWAILGLHFSNSFADEAVEDLKKQCAGGKISGVFTKYQGRNFFLWTTRTVTAKAFCEIPGARS